MIDLYKECLFNRYYEYKVAEYIDKKWITCPTYLSVGSEYIPVILKRALKNLGINKVNLFLFSVSSQIYFSSQGVSPQ